MPLCLVLMLASALLCACSNNTDEGDKNQTQPTENTTQNYLQTIDTMRVQKDQAFAVLPDSPLPNNEKSRFKGLKYFEVDTSFRVLAAVERILKPATINIANSDQTDRPFVGTVLLRFVINKKPFELTAYQSQAEYTIVEQTKKDPKTRLFIPFSDQTSGNETYATGRYIDIEIENKDTLLRIDFNQAYNPYCAYNPTYSCPIPPQNNHLNTKINAGEKNYHD